MSIVAVTTPGAKGFFEWMQRALPQTYKGVRREFSSASGVSGMGLVAPDPATAASTAPMTPSFMDTIREMAQVAGQAYLTTQQVKAQQQILNVQLDRQARGLAPLAIDPTTYGLPQPSIGISLSPQTQKLVMYGGIGLILAVVLGLVGGGHASRRR